MTKNDKGRKAPRRNHEFSAPPRNAARNGGEIDPVNIDPVNIDPVNIDPVNIDPVNKEKEAGEQFGVAESVSPRSNRWLGNRMWGAAAQARRLAALQEIPRWEPPLCRRRTECRFHCLSMLLQTCSMTMSPFDRRRGVTVLLCLAVLVAPVTLRAADELDRRDSLTIERRGAATSAARLGADVAFLASDELQGRGVGTEGIEKATEYIADTFVRLGLETDLFDGRPLQPVRVPRPVAIDPEKKNAASIASAGDEDEVLELQHDFNPLGLGTSGRVDAPVVFAGYGITAPERDYDDYAAIDAKDKIVLILRKEPESWRTSKRPSKFAYFSTKMSNAVAHGAAGMILVNDRRTLDEARAQQVENFVAAVNAMPKVEATMFDSNAEATVVRRAVKAAVDRVRAAELQMDDRVDEPIATTNAGQASGPAIPAISITRAIADRMLASAGAATLDDIEAEIAATEKPQSTSLSEVRMQFVTGLTDGFAESFNVLASLPGSGALADETVFVGAHYDHVGMGGMGSLAPGTVAVHNGADDNASGTAALLEVARRLAEQPPAGPRRRIVFAAFTGEESGLIGSKHYIREPRYPVESTAAMVNMDMVGRLNDNRLTVFGTGTAEGFDALLDAVNEEYRFEMERQATGNGPSDHQSFYNAKIPVLHFFTGLHSEYHRPDDDFDKINVTGLARITDIVTDVVIRLATQSQRPGYIATGGTSEIRYQKRPYLGIVTEDVVSGLRVDEVLESSPAERGGLQAGDVIVRLDDSPIANLEELRTQLAKRGIGDSIELVVVREEQQHRLQIELGSRQ